MANTQQPKPMMLRIQLALAHARILSFSLFVHLVLVIAAGSVVIIHVQQHPPDFEAPAGEIIATPSELNQEFDSPPTDLNRHVPTGWQVACALPAHALKNSVSAPVSFTFSPSATAAIASHGAGLSGAAGIGEKIAGAVAKAGKLGGTMRYFGNKEKSADALVGTFYDLKQTRNRKPTGITPDEYHQVFRRFVSQNWRTSILDDYFRAPQPLYASQIMIPNMSANEGPKAFDMEKEVQPSRWLVHYKGRVSPPRDGTYRFVGAGDDVMVVRFNGKVVLDRCWSQEAAEWKADRNYDYGWTKIPNGFARGDALRVKAGQYYDLEVLIGEQPGGLVFACLLMEKEGEQYAQDSRGNPVLPVFRVADVAMPELQPGQTLPPHLADGPVWKAQTLDRSRSDLDRFTSMRQ